MPRYNQINVHLLGNAQKTKKGVSIKLSLKHPPNKKMYLTNTQLKQLKKNIAKGKKTSRLNMSPMQIVYNEKRGGSFLGFLKGAARVAKNVGKKAWEVLKSDEMKPIITGGLDLVGELPQIKNDPKKQLAFSAFRRIVGRGRNGAGYLRGRGTSEGEGEGSGYLRRARGSGLMVMNPRLKTEKLPRLKKNDLLIPV